MVIVCVVFYRHLFLNLCMKSKLNFSVLFVLRRVISSSSKVLQTRMVSTFVSLVVLVASFIYNDEFLII